MDQPKAERALTAADAAALSKRRYRRRILALGASLLSERAGAAQCEGRNLSVDGVALSAPSSMLVGERGLCRLAIGGGEILRAPIRVVWKRAGSGTRSIYGMQFCDLGPTERAALQETIYGRSIAQSAAAIFDEDASDPPDGQAPSAFHTSYYLRLIRRLEQVHGFSAQQSDRLLFARLYQSRPLTDALVEQGHATHDGLEAYLSAAYEVPYVDLEREHPDPRAAEVIPVGIATAHSIVPIRLADGIVIAMADPADLPTLDLLQMRSRERIDIRFALIEDVEKAINAVYHSASLRSVDRLFDKLAQTTGLLTESDSAKVEDLEALRKMSDATPIITLVDSILRSAVEDRASDIHIEPFLDKISVRFRLDGVLREMRALPKSASAAVTSRIKVMARMDITIRHLPQDGRASMRYLRKDFDLRVSSLPTVYGEKIVIRLLEKNPSFKTLRAIGFSDANYDLFAPLGRRPFGMVLSCGPTGSGKSTTLFACLQEINDGCSNITTIEEPVEYRVAGVNQVEVNVKRGLTFASVLRSLLRQDPDVIYVGEIRDRETADLAVRAALTGHLLLSTLHTNSAVQAIARLVDIGVEPALIASSLSGIVAQRLVRRICERCGVEYRLSADEAIVVRELTGGNPVRSLRRGTGCSHCHETGYFGRLGVHEVIVVDEHLRRLIASGAGSSQLLDYVARQGFVDLRADALRRLLAGETTLREVMRVTV